MALLILFFILDLLKKIASDSSCFVDTELSCEQLLSTLDHGHIRCVVSKCSELGSPVVIKAYFRCRAGLELDGVRETLCYYSGASWICNHEHPVCRVSRKDCPTATSWRYGPKCIWLQLQQRTALQALDSCPQGARLLQLVSRSMMRDFRSFILRTNDSRLLHPNGTRIWLKTLVRSTGGVWETTSGRSNRTFISGDGLRSFTEEVKGNPQCVFAELDAKGVRLQYFAILSGSQCGTFRHIFACQYIPTRVVEQCSPAPELPSGALQIRQDPSTPLGGLGSLLILDCRPPARLIGAPYLRCSQSGVWIGFARCDISENLPPPSVNRIPPKTQNSANKSYQDAMLIVLATSSAFIVLMLLFISYGMIRDRCLVYRCPTVDRFCQNSCLMCRDPEEYSVNSEPVANATDSDREQQESHDEGEATVDQASALTDVALDTATASRDISGKPAEVSACTSCAVSDEARNSNYVYENASFQHCADDAAKSNNSLESETTAVPLRKSKNGGKGKIWLAKYLKENSSSVELTESNARPQGESEDESQTTAL